MLSTQAPKPCSRAQKDLRGWFPSAFSTLLFSLCLTNHPSMLEIHPLSLPYTHRRPKIHSGASSSIRFPASHGQRGQMQAKGRRAAFSFRADICQSPGIHKTNPNQLLRTPLQLHSLGWVLSKNQAFYQGAEWKQDFLNEAANILNLAYPTW